MGPKGLPAWHRLMPTAAATTRSVDRKMESPMPDSGPMRAALTSLTLSGSISPRATFSSMAIAMPPTNGANWTVMLKNAQWRCRAAA